MKSPNPRTLALILGLAAALSYFAFLQYRARTASPSYSLPAPAPSPQDNRPAEGLRLQAKTGAEGVEVAWEGEPGEAALFRSTASLALTGLDDVRYPIVTLPLPGPSGTLVDRDIPDGVTLYYQARLVPPGGAALYSPVVSVAVPERPLPSLQSPSLLVDKVHYYLEVRDGGRPVKRYPVALGANPFKRKLHQDNASTPEGRYRIYNTQPQATFYRAYDLDYPNDADEARYALAAEKGLLPQPKPDIGGEIQIHGKGILANWTFGCVALRNEDMDELFAHPEIGTGTPVDIVGREITRAVLAMEAEDLKRVQQALQARGFAPGPADGQPGPATRRALGLFQVDSGLPLTCEPDEETLRKLLGPETSSTGRQ